MLVIKAEPHETIKLSLKGVPICYIKIQNTDARLAFDIHESITVDRIKRDDIKYFKGRKKD